MDNNINNLKSNLINGKIDNQNESCFKFEKIETQQNKNTSLRDNRMASNDINYEKNTNENNKVVNNFPFNKKENFLSDKKMKFINIRTKSSNDLLKEEFKKKYFDEDDLNESNKIPYFNNNSCLDFEKHTKNFQKQNSNNNSNLNIIRDLNLKDNKILSKTLNDFDLNLLDVKYFLK